MRKLFLYLLVFLVLASNAQTRNERTMLAGKSIYAELAGASFMAGLNYDSRFHENSRWGYRIGLAYTLAAIDEIDFCCDCGGSSSAIRGFNIPMEINYLVGRRETKSKLDLGLGVNLGYYDRRDEDLFGYFMFMNTGYRFQPRQGVTFRIGLSPKLSLNGESGIIEYVWITSFIPYFSIGYAF